MVNLPPDLEGPLIARARAANRSVANYIENLIAQDLRESAGALAEEPARYEGRGPAPAGRGAEAAPTGGGDLGAAVIAAALKKKNGGR